MSKSQHVHSLDSPDSEIDEEAHCLFTVDTHTVRSVSVKEGKKFFCKLKLAAAGFTGNGCSWTQPPLPTPWQ